LKEGNFGSINQKYPNMKPITTTWNKEELKTYLLIYCAHADFHESIVEMDYIYSKHPSGHFDAIHKEFEGDNDFISVQKITNTVERLELTPSEITALKNEIKLLFLADGEFDTQEENLLRGLTHLF
jgi:hypothetical protein